MPRLHSRSTLANIDAKITTLGGNSICTVANLPNATHEARTTKYLKIAGGAGVERLPVVIVGGVHARELAQPPALLNFLADLIAAYNSGAAARNPITVARFDDTRGAVTRSYPEFTIPAPVVQRIVERLDLYVIPVVNPDGRNFVLSSVANDMWRKNRSPSPVGTVCVPASSAFGVDINRNFNFAWDVDVYYSATAASNAAISRDPCHWDEYNGPSAGSEAETKNVQWLVDEKKPKFFVDCHSHGRWILTPWATDNNQSGDSNKNFRNANWDRGGSSGERDGVTVATYGEYFPNGAPERLLDAHNTLGNSIRDKIRTKAGETYNPPQQSAKLYEPWGRSGITGTSTDYAFSRQFIAASGFPSVFSIAMEFGHATDDGFHPHPTRVYPKVEREIYAALWAILDYAATWTAPAASGGCSGCGDCFIATAAFDSDVHPDVIYLKRLRDDVLAPTVLGKKFIGAVLFVYNNISPPMARFIRKRNRLRAFVRNVFVKPVIWQIQKADQYSKTANTSEQRVSLFMKLLVLLLFANVSVLIVIGFVLGKYFSGN